MNCTAACHKKVDIAIALDASGSISRNNFNEALNFLQKLVSVITVSPNEARVGVIVYSTRLRVRIKLNQYTTVAALKNAIAKLLHTPRGYTNTPLAIDYIRWLLNNKLLGGRPNPVPNVGIIFTGNNVP